MEVRELRRRRHQMKYILAIGNQDRHQNYQVTVLNLEAPYNPMDSEGYVDSRETYEVSTLLLSEFSSRKPRGRKHFKLDQNSIKDLQNIVHVRKMEQAEGERKKVTESERARAKVCSSTEDYHQFCVDKIEEDHDSLACYRWCTNESVNYHKITFMQCGNCWEYLIIQAFSGLTCLNEECLCNTWTTMPDPHHHH